MRNTTEPDMYGNDLTRTDSFGSPRKDTAEATQPLAEATLSGGPFDGSVVALRDDYWDLHVHDKSENPEAIHYSYRPISLNVFTYVGPVKSRRAAKRKPPK